MEKVYLVENLDCGSCADQIERNVKKLKGVEDASMNFLTQKLSVSASEERHSTLLKDIQKIAKRVERGAVVSA